MDDDLLAGEFFERRNGRRALARENGVVDGRVGRGELGLAQPEIGIGRALEHVHRAVGQGLVQAGPVHEHEADGNAHGLAHGFGEIDVEAGRLAVFVEIFVRRIVLVAADKKEAVGCAWFLGAGSLGESGEKEQEQYSKKCCNTLVFHA